MRGIKVPQAPPRSARPPPWAGAFATFQAIDNAGVLGGHKVRSTKVAAPTRRSSTARLISLVLKVRSKPNPPIRPKHKRAAQSKAARLFRGNPDQASSQTFS